MSEGGRSVTALKKHTKEQVMKITPKSGATIAIAAATIIVAGAAIQVAPAMAEAKGQCVGANACKGHSDCKTAKNDCKGANACKGQGYVTMTEKDCSEKGGKFKKA
jgi:hypothetical protein